MTRLPDDCFICQDPSPELLEKVFELRVTAWRARQSRFAQDISSWTDQFDAKAEHFVAVRSGCPVAAGRLSIHAKLEDGPDGEIYAGLSLPASRPIGVLSRLVVHPAFAKLGFAQALDRIRLNRARLMGCKSVFVATNAGPVRLAQLEAQGFRELTQVQLQADGPLKETPAPTILGQRLNAP